MYKHKVVPGSAGAGRVMIYGQTGAHFWGARRGDGAQWNTEARYNRVSQFLQILIVFLNTKFNFS